MMLGSPNPASANLRRPETPKGRPLILRNVALAASAVVLTFGIAACGSDSSDSSSTSTTAAATTTTTSAAASTPAAAAGAPTAEDLQANLDLIADSTKTTPEKVAVVVDGEKRAANIDKMNALLGTYGKLKFTVTDVKVEGTTATASVTIESPSAPGQPSPPMPMTWENVDGTWKLSDATACTLLAFAQAPCTP